MNIVEQIVSGDIRRRLVSFATLTMRSPRQGRLRELYPHTGKAFVIGFTGSPGVGKTPWSTGWRPTTGRPANNRYPGRRSTSPFTGGAIFGDRIRMQRHFVDPGVFIRSLATRGHFGGLSKSTGDMVNVLDAAGKEVIVIETVGVGQDEVDIVDSVRTTILVTVPGMGTISRRQGRHYGNRGHIRRQQSRPRRSRKTVRELLNLVELHDGKRNGDDWEPQILETEATTPREIEKLSRSSRAQDIF